MTKTISAAIIAIMLATPAMAAELEGFQMFFCHTEPYPVGKTCTRTPSVHVERDACENEVARFHSSSVLRAECHLIVIDCSTQQSVLCAAARDRALGRGR